MTPWLYTRCPHCDTVYRIGASQIRQARGEVCCDRCEQTFDALTALSDTAAGTVTDSEPDTPPRLSAAVDSMPAEPAAGTLPWEAEPAPNRPKRLAWGLAAAAMVPLLAFQIGWHDGERLSQNPTLRPGLEATCRLLGCTLPVFRAPARIEVIDRILTPHADGSLEFRLKFSNAASLPQAYPDLQLTLLRFNGGILAQRRFKPDEYLSPPPATNSFAHAQVAEAILRLQPPESAIGGYQIHFI